jgi:hypothetical protein
LVCLLGLVFLKRQAIDDWFRLLGYTPPQSIQQLASDDTMNSYSRHLFYLNRPQLLSSVASFRSNCPENTNEDVLGCYHSGENGIYIYNVQDPSLQGVAEVTAAHEVLHAIYARLSSSTRSQLDSELESYYLHGLTDTVVKSEIKVYQQTEPNDVYDEMSCTFGTEVAVLPAALNSYYSHYFTNRMAIIAYNDKYRTQFTLRENTINSDDNALATLNQTITNEESHLEVELSQINSEQIKLSGLDNLSHASQYNAAVAVYNTEVNSYDAQVSVLQANIATYNQNVAARNLIAGELTTLDNALNTTLTPKNPK